jgi:hypothetical protein
MEGMMQIEAVPILADALKEYYHNKELKEICSLFDVVFDDEGERPHFSFAKRMVSDIEHGNNRRFFEAIMPQLLTRCDEHIAHTSFERQDYHRGMWKPIQQLSAMLGEPQIPRELTVTQDQPFTAKSAVRDFLEPVTTELAVVDNYVGLGTLDCVRDVQTPPR